MSLIIVGLHGSKVKNNITFLLVKISNPIITFDNEVEEVLFSPLFVCLFVCLFVNNFLTTILVVE